MQNVRFVLDQGRALFRMMFIHRMCGRYIKVNPLLIYPASLEGAGQGAKSTAVIRLPCILHHIRLQYQSDQLRI